MKKILLIFIYAFVLNWVWENLHSFLYYLPSGQPITQYMILKSTLGDAIFITILGIMFLKVEFFKEKKWHLAAFAFFAAFLVEKYALMIGLWAYNDLMPIIPLLNTGLTPTIQLGLLFLVVLKVVDTKMS